MPDTGITVINFKDMKRMFMWIIKVAHMDFMQFQPLLSIILLKQINTCKNLQFILYYVVINILRLHKPGFVKPETFSLQIAKCF